MALPTLESLVEALRPRSVTAAMQTTAMSATRRAYSTSEAPRSVLQRDCSQALTNSYEVSIGVVSLKLVLTIRGGDPGGFLSK
jgi:hypothetical protein